jgi:ribonucleoside-diphosphate reductase beta chain
LPSEHQTNTTGLTSPIFQERNCYKPFAFPWAYTLWKTQMQMHWMADDVPSWREDIEDWNSRLSADEKELLTQILTFFTQGDIDVAGAYCKKYLPMFHHPELVMMMSIFASTEANHIDAYSKLIETLGFPESTYSKFLEYKDMADKHNYLWETKNFGDPVKNIAFDIAKFSAFSEGLQLYSSFAILKSFELVNKMKGMAQIVTWSVKDESVHVEGMINIFKTIVQENPHIMDEQFVEELYSLAQQMVQLEFNFIDMAFSKSDGGAITLDWINKEDVKKFVEYTANRRLMQLGLEPIFETRTNPFLWFDYLISAVEHANFFEQRGSDYQKVSLDIEEKMEW